MFRGNHVIHNHHLHLLSADLHCDETIWLQSLGGPHVFIGEGPVNGKSGLSWNAPHIVGSD